MVAYVGDLRGRGPGHALGNGKAVALRHRLLVVTGIQDNNASRSDGRWLNACDVIEGLGRAVRWIWNTIGVLPTRKAHRTCLNVLLIVIAIHTVTATQYGPAAPENVICKPDARVIEEQSALCTAQGNFGIDAVPLKARERRPAAGRIHVVGTGDEDCGAFAAFIHPRPKVVETQ